MTAGTSPAGRWTRRSGTRPACQAGPPHVASPLGTDQKYPSTTSLSPPRRLPRSPLLASQGGCAIQWGQVARDVTPGWGWLVFIRNGDGVRPAPSHDPSHPGSIPRGQRTPGGQGGLLPAGGSPASCSQGARCQAGTAPEVGALAPVLFSRS